MQTRRDDIAEAGQVHAALHQSNVQCHVRIEWGSCPDRSGHHFSLGCNRHHAVDHETEIITKPAGQTIADVIHRGRVNADLILFRLHELKVGAKGNSARRTETLAEGLNTTIFVRDAGEFAGKLGQAASKLEPPWRARNAIRSLE